MSTIEQVAAGLQIFAKYSGDVSAEHDVIYASPNRMKDIEISKADQVKLFELDWSFDESHESWYHFV